MKAYPSYKEYKPSNVDWLGEIPEHWEIRKLKYCFMLKTQKATGARIPVALENIESWTGKYLPSESEFEGDGIAFESHDILFGKLRPYLAKVWAAEFAGEAIGDFFVLHPLQHLNSRFAAYYMRTSDFINLIDGSTFGSKMPRASWDFFSSTPINLPPLSEQQMIADFLDRETAKIDSLIQKRNDLIKLLQEKRSAVISHAVTKGIDPTVRLKPSNIDWLGEIPEHWEAIPLKYLLYEKLKYGANELAIDEDETQPRFVRITDISDDGTLRPDTFKSIDIQIAKEYLLAENDLLFARSGATVGKTFLYQKSWGVTAFAGYLIRARFSLHKANSKFIFFCTRSSFYWQWIKAATIQATIQNVSAEKYASFCFPLPPLLEQQKIVDFLARETAKIDSLIEKEKQIIEKMKEYRTALISAAVTGKIDVRGEENA